MSDQAETECLLSLTAQIVAAQVSNNSIAAGDVPALINTVHQTLAALGKAPAEPKHPEPAVPIKKSVFPDYIVCLEDGKKLKMLKRHLKTAYNMTPAEYRERWGLSREYPMVAPNYAEQRSSLALKIGLGQRSTRTEKAAPVEAAPATVAAAPKALKEEPARRPSRRARKKSAA